MNAPTGIIDIRGKQYQTVALRVQTFRERHPDFGLATSVVERDEDCVVMRAEIADPSGRVIATGHAEEYRKSSQINRTSALENAETSAIGRALAAFGLGGTEFASANEVVNAIHQQNAPHGADAAGGYSQRERRDQPPAANGSTLRDQLEQSVAETSAPKKRGEAHSQLKTLYRRFVHALEGCGDQSEFDGLFYHEKSQALIAEIKEKLPDWWEGGAGEPEEFVPLKDLIDRKQYEFAQHIADLARA